MITTGIAIVAIVAACYFYDEWQLERKRRISLEAICDSMLRTTGHNGDQE